MSEDEKTSNSGVQISNIQNSQVTTGPILNQVTAGRDVVLGDKQEIHYHYYGSQAEPVEAKARQEFEPEMVFIPTGQFVMGSDEGELPERPQHEVVLNAYFISKYPITNRRYLEYVSATGAPVPAAGWRLVADGMEPPLEKLDHPVVGINWDEARNYCNWLCRETERHYRLPTEAEWEKAARGGAEAFPYPWGKDFDPTFCNISGGTTPVGLFSPQGDSPYGCADMAGNVWEWTGTCWGNNYSSPTYRYPYKIDQRENPAAQLPHREYRLIRGGSYLDDPAWLRSSARNREAADERSPVIGFRVVIEIAPS